MVIKKRRTVITGIGVINPLGPSNGEFWENLISCRSGVSRITLLDAASFPTRIAAEVKNFDPKLYVEKRKSLKIMTRDMQFAVAAAREAIEDARLDMQQLDPTRLGVVFGAGMISLPQ